MHSQVERRRCIHISEAERVLEDVRVPGRRKQLGLGLIGQAGPKTSPRRLAVHVANMSRPA